MEHHPEPHREPAVSVLAATASALLSESHRSIQGRPLLGPPMLALAAVVLWGLDWGSPVHQRTPAGTLLQKGEQTLAANETN